jgi:hypothetical protein
MTKRTASAKSERINRSSKHSTTVLDFRSAIRVPPECLPDYPVCNPPHFACHVDFRAVKERVVSGSCKPLLGFAYPLVENLEHKRILAGRSAPSTVSRCARLSW